MLIYCVEDKSNGKKYVGKKKLTPKLFLGSRYYGGGILIKAAVKKYGRENFVRFIIELCKSQLPLNKFKGLEGSGSQPRTERPNS